MLISAEFDVLMRLRWLNPMDSEPNFHSQTRIFSQPEIGGGADLDSSVVTDPKYLNISKREFQILDAILSRHYRLGCLITAKRNTLGYMNANYEVETEKRGERDRFILRIYRPGLSKEGIDFEHTLLNELSRRSYHYAPQPIRARTGHSYVKTTKNMGAGDLSYFVAVFEFKTGRDKYSWDKPLCTASELQDAAGVLAHYHTIIHRWAPGVNAVADDTFGKLPDMRRRWHTFRHSLAADDFSAYFFNKLDILTGAAKQLEAWKKENACWDFPIIAVHGDYHPGNLKYSGNKVVAVLDFDWSHMDLRIYDVGLAVFYFCTSWEPDSDGRIQLDRLRHFLRAYQLAARDYSWIDPLPAEEAECLPQMIQLANLFIVDWTLNHYFTRGGDTEKYLGYLRHGLRVCEWLEKNHQRLVEAIS
jgi:homoserine kinase type II